ALLEVELVVGGPPDRVNDAVCFARAVEVVELRRCQPLAGRVMMGVLELAQDLGKRLVIKSLNRRPSPASGELHAISSRSIVDRPWMTLSLFGGLRTRILKVRSDTAQTRSPFARGVRKRPSRRGPAPPALARVCRRARRLPRAGGHAGAARAAVVGGAARRRAAHPQPRNGEIRQGQNGALVAYPRRGRFPPDHTPMRVARNSGGRALRCQPPARASFLVGSPECSEELPRDVPPDVRPAAYRFSPGGPSTVTRMGRPPVFSSTMTVVRHVQGFGPGFGRP